VARRGETFCARWQSRALRPARWQFCAFLAVDFAQTCHLGPADARDCHLETGMARRTHGIATSRRGLGCGRTGLPLRDGCRRRRPHIVPWWPGSGDTEWRLRELEAFSFARWGFGLHLTTAIATESGNPHSTRRSHGLSAPPATAAGARTCPNDRNRRPASTRPNDRTRPNARTRRPASTRPNDRTCPNARTRGPKARTSHRPSRPTKIYRPIGRLNQIRYCILTFYES
jgi:hypothetical protein